MLPPDHQGANNEYASQATLSEVQSKYVAGTDHSRPLGL
jgi:hypothetical protein